MRIERLGRRDRAEIVRELLHRVRAADHRGTLEQPCQGDLRYADIIRRGDPFYLGNNRPAAVGGASFLAFLVAGIGLRRAALAARGAIRRAVLAA